MNMNGKVLFFNESDGNGIIITAKKSKLNFSVMHWNDFDVMPEKGLEVVFDEVGSNAENVVSKESCVPEEDEEEAVEVITEKETVVEVEEAAVEEESLAEQTPMEQTEENADEALGEIFEEVPEKVPEETQEQAEEEVLEKEEIPAISGDVSAAHFEAENEINALEIEEEVAKERPTSISNTLTIKTAVDNYFNNIKHNIEIRKNYKKVAGRLDYLVIKRFLWTTYNNLVDIDIRIITPKIKMLSDDLKEMGSVYEDFRIKTKNPPLAYDEVFLSAQEEYQKIKEGAANLIERLKHLKASEKQLGGVRGLRKKELEESIKTPQFDALKNELKSLNGAYVDVVHMMAELDEIYKKDMKILTDFEAEYREDFYELFNVESQKNKDNLVDILNAQAFFFDSQQWSAAKDSKLVKSHFQKSNISGELNTKTYLKYYLSTQDEQKASGETKKLFDLYNYLVSVQKDFILVVTASPQDAMEYESAIKKADKSYAVQSFVDEIKAIKWAKKNSVKVMVVEEELQKVRVEKFLNIYSKNILSVPKVLLIGAKPNVNTMSITSLLGRGASAQVVAKCVKSLVETKAKDGEEEKVKKAKKGK